MGEMSRTHPPFAGQARPLKGGGPRNTNPGTGRGKLARSEEVSAYTRHTTLDMRYGLPRPQAERVQLHECAPTQKASDLPS